MLKVDVRTPEKAVAAGDVRRRGRTDKLACTGDTP